MKFGKDFWFWIRLIIQILKAILDIAPKNPEPKLTPGHRAFNAVCNELVLQNEDDVKATPDLD